MKQFWYSEILKKYFETEEACKKAEDEYNQKHAVELKAKEERARRAKEVNDAYAHYVELKNKFIKDYNEFHMTYRNKDDDIESFFDYLFKLI